MVEIAMTRATPTLLDLPILVITAIAKTTRRISQCNFFSCASLTTRIIAYSEAAPS
jgi:hypothetical protein